MENNCEFNIKPYATSKSDDKTSSPFGVNYVNQDYWGFKNRMIEYIRQNKSKEFNDFTESSVVIMLIELWAFLADTLSFKIDQIGNELFIDTVTELTNALRLCKLVGFRPTPPLPAKAMFIGSLNGVLSEDLRIPTPIKITYDVPGIGNKNIELFACDSNNQPMFNEPIVIPAGNLFTNSVVGIEGTTRHLNYTSNGNPYQVIKLGGEFVLNGSIIINVDNILWKDVECFSNNEPNLEYIIEYGPNYTASIIFGDGQGGMVPGKGSNISITYRQGGGSVGNIITGAINTPIRVSGLMPNTIVVNFKNFTRGEGGYNGDDIEDIRRKLPLYLKTQDRAVTAQDYKSIAELYSSYYNGSIGKAVASLRNSGCSGNIIDLYVLANLGNDILTKPSDILIEKLATEIDKKKMLSDYVCVRSGDIVNVDITIDLVISNINRKNELNIKDKIVRRIKNIFSLSNLDFGKSLKESDVIRALSDIKEIEDINITFITVQSLEENIGHINNINVKYNQMIQLDNLAINFNYK